MAGCWTCRLRRKKCDAQRPTCNVCRMLLIPCYGYGPKPGWKDGGPREKEMVAEIRSGVKATTDSLRRARALHALRQKHPLTATDGTPKLLAGLEGVTPTWRPTHSDEQLLDEYFDHVFPLQFPFYVASLPERGHGWLRALMVRCEPLCYAALALVLVYRDPSSHRPDAIRGRPRENEQQRLYGLAVTGLRQHIDRLSEKSVQESLRDGIEVFACVVYLIMLENSRGRLDAWQKHMIASPGMFPYLQAYCLAFPYHRLSALYDEGKQIEEAISQASSTDSSLALVDHVAVEFFSAVFLWFDTLATVSTGCKPQFADICAAAFGASDSKVRLRKIMGCENWVMVIIRDIAVLDGYRRGGQEGQLRRGEDVCQKYIELKERLQLGLAEPWESYLQLLARGSTDRAAETWLVQATPIVTHVFACAALVYLTVVLSGPDPHLPEIRDAVSRSLKIFSVLPDVRLLHAMLWPFCVTGCMALKDQESLFEELAVKAGTLTQGPGVWLRALQVMKTCWQIRSEGSQDHPSADCQCLRAGLKCTYEEKPAKRGRRRRGHAHESTLPYSGSLIRLNSPTSRISELSPTAPSGNLAEHEFEFDGLAQGIVPDRYCERFDADGQNYAFESQTSDSGTIAVNDDPCMIQDVLLPEDELSRGDDIWNAIDEFFDTLYVVFPILSYASLASRLIIEPAWRAIPEFRTLLLSIRAVNAAGQFRMAPSDTAHLSELITQVEKSRLEYDFADPPTLDSVVVSLFLFTGNNVLEKHNRAFLYLDEALSLLEVVGVADEEERHRKAQIEQVLFNTEAATMAIYANQGRRRRARRPREVVDLPLRASHTLGALDESDRVALHLLRRLTEIHLAENAEAFDEIDIDSEADMATLFGAVFKRHRYSRIQAADVVVTRQWQLSTKLVANLKMGIGISPRLQKSVEALGLAAMSWICLLGEGELRIVGLGKLSSLAQNIRVLAGRSQCQYILGGLAGAVIKEDHEKIFAPQLAEVVMPLISTVPASLNTRPPYEYQSLRSQARTAIQVEPMSGRVFETNSNSWDPSTSNDAEQTYDGNSLDPIDRFIDLS
ncbi:hypothetical protein FOPE_09208 [Fonsecaea pedrosoi]|nr:hypothetical protein FOPE_09208 [Fonsecaea pedrosoi]